MLKNFIIRIFLPIIIFLTVIIFLWFCPPIAGQYKFNIILLTCAIVCFLYGLIVKDCTISGLIITTGNGLTRFSPTYYPTVSFLNCCLLFGYFLSMKPDDEKLFIQNSRNNGIVPLVLVFWLINLLSAFFHILILTKPGIVFVVNRSGMINIEIIYHIVGYVLFPLTCSILLFLLMSDVVQKKKEEKFLTYLAVGCILSSFVGILQATGVIKGIFGYVIPWELRVNGLFSDFNSFSLSLGMLLPVFSFYFFHMKKVGKKILFFLSTILGGINLLLAGTRSGILVVVMFVIFYSFTLLLKKKYREVLVLTMCVVVLFLVGKKILSYQKNKFYGIQRLVSYFSTSITVQIQERKFLWNTGVNLWKKNILTGNGIKSVYKEFSNINPEWIQSDNACNTYIQYIAEIGIIGLSVFVIIIILILLITNNDVLRAVMCSFLIALFFGHHIEAEEVGMIFWCYLGIMSNNVWLKNNFVKIARLLSYGSLIFFLIINIFSFVKNYNNLDIFKYNTFAGLYKPEKLYDRKFFWTDKLVLAKMSRVANKKISFEFNSGGVKNQKVKIFFDNKEYKEIKLPENQWVTTTVTVPHECKILKIVPEKTFIPAGKVRRYIFPFNGSDYRRLGVMLSFI